MDKDKTYVVGLSLGRATDTQDASGNTLYEKPVLHNDTEIVEVIKALLAEESRYLQCIRLFVSMVKGSMSLPARALK